MKKLLNKELEDLLQKHTPKQIIYMYISHKINLTSKQLDKLIKLKGDV